MSGMIDWLTLFLDASLLDRESMQAVLDNTDKVQRINGITGEVMWSSPVRESLRSDDHCITVTFGSRLKIEGSPARVNASHNVFGSLDIKQCALDMITFVSKYHSIILPRRLEMWSCSRIDITQNFDMGSLTQCQVAIDQLKPLKCGVQKTNTYDTSVIWGQGSSKHSGKAYLKGTHLRELVAKNKARATPKELDLADRILRLEYSLRRGLISRYKDSGLIWYNMTPEMLLQFHSNYFEKFISRIEVPDMENILELLLANVGEGADKIPTEAQARAAYSCYSQIKLVGFKIARESFVKRSWYRHIKNLKTIGLVAADLQPINVVPLRKRQIVLDNPVSSWDDFKHIA